MPMHGISILAFDWTAAFTALAGVLVGGALAAVAIRLLTGSVLGAARQEAGTIRKAAESEADALHQRAKLDAETAAKERKAQIDQEAAETRSELKQRQDRLAKREDSLESSMSRLEEREKVIDKRQKTIDQKQQESDRRSEALEIRDEEITTKLTEVSGLSIDQARDELLKRVSEASQEEAAHLRRTIMERTEADARRDSREITVMAIQRFAAEHVAETTVRSVKIPSDDMKGRIIGREGRNIRAIEQATGVDVLVDDTPGVISVSCFDPI